MRSDEREEVAFAWNEVSVLGALHVQ